MAKKKKKRNRLPPLDDAVLPSPPSLARSTAPWLPARPHRARTSAVLRLQVAAMDRSLSPSLASSSSDSRQVSSPNPSRRPQQIRCPRCRKLAKRREGECLPPPQLSNNDGFPGSSPMQPSDTEEAIAEFSLLSFSVVSGLEFVVSACLSADLSIREHRLRVLPVEGMPLEMVADGQGGRATCVVGAIVLHTAFSISSLN
ncbi:hypothetical protein EJB05_45429, partial [Eragrostis curvula]